MNPPGVAGAEARKHVGEALTVAQPFLIQQQWDAYTDEQHAVWAELVRRRMPQLREHAAEEYLNGFEQIGLREDTIPNLADVNRRLGPRTGWNSTPVSGFLPPDAFFEMLGARQFPTTTYIRSREAMDYTPEPDIFHDVFGHVPMHAHPVFADFLQHYGRVCARLMHDTLPAASTLIADRGYDSYWFRDWPSRCRFSLLWVGVFGFLWFVFATASLSIHDPIVGGSPLRGSLLPASIAGSLFGNCSRPV